MTKETFSPVFPIAWQQYFTLIFNSLYSLLSSLRDKGTIKEKKEKVKEKEKGIELPRNYPSNFSSTLSDPAQIMIKVSPRFARVSRHLAPRSFSRHLSSNYCIGVFAARERVGKRWMKFPRNDTTNLPSFDVIRFYAENDKKGKVSSRFHVSAVT